MNKARQVKEHLVCMLKGGNTYLTLEEVLDNIPYEKSGIVPDNLPYSMWQQLEHIRIAQNDILEFSSNPEHQSPEWPAEYWPKEKAPESESMLNASIKEIIGGRDRMIALIESADAESIFQVFYYGNGQTLFWEALILAEHNAYHIGQLMMMKRLLGMGK